MPRQAADAATQRLHGHTFTILHGALLEVGLQRDRIGRVERDLVDELARVEPRHEHEALRHLVAPARLDARAHLAATRDDAHLRTPAHAERLRVVGVHVHDRVRERAVELRHAARHRPRMPVLEHAAGRQPERILLVRATPPAARRAARRCTRCRPDCRRTGSRCRPSRTDRCPRGSASCVSLPLTTGQRRPRASWYVSNGARSWPWPRPNSRVLLEQSLLQVEAEGLRFVVGIAVLDLRHRESLSTLPLRNSMSYSVLPRISGCLAMSSAGHTSSTLKRLENSTSCHRSDRDSPGASHHLVPELRAPLRVAVRAFLLDPHRRRQHEVGGKRRHRRIGFGHDDEVVGIAIAGIALLAPGWARPACCC